MPDPRPIAERSLLMPEASQSPGCSSTKIGRVIGEWRDQGSGYDKRHSQPRTRSRKKPAAPLRWRLLHTNNPERKNISDMKNASLNPTNKAKPLPRWLSTTGKACHQRGGHRRREGTVRQNRMMGEHRDSDERSQVSNGQVERTGGLRYSIRHRAARSWPAEVTPQFHSS